MVPVITMSWWNLKLGMGHEVGETMFHEFVLQYLLGLLSGVPLTVSPGFRSLTLWRQW